jgi:hypothetical protein
MLENVTELGDMTRFLQTLDMCAFRANVTRLLFVVDWHWFWRAHSQNNVFRALFRWIIVAS